MRSSPGSSSAARAVGGRSAQVGTALLGLFLALSTAGCRSTQRPPAGDVAEPPPPYAPAQSDAVPGWLGEPLSWEKLARVESWLANEGRTATAIWRNEAELTLSSGRLTFARRELDADPAKAPAVATRLRAAKAGFDRLLLREDLNAGQRRRASEGAELAAKLLAGAPGARPPGAIATIARADWGALRAKPALMDRTSGPYSRITIHHSADNDPVVLDGSPGRTFAAARDIQRAHMNGKETRYGDIGYHFLIDPFGRVLEGRDLAYQGAHAMGDNNIKNVGICLIGNFDQDKPSEAALGALRRLVDDLRGRYSIPRERVYGHRDLRVTRCPGENLNRWIVSYRGGAPQAPPTALEVKPQAAASRSPRSVR
ncbi:MAG: N-acetylmuramoyl-L-alanine amidase [Planctomycetes bacterium]|nr:N-acetylmuramoyl-L-alanine amidase [Planctomycetota bacterium]